MAKANPRLIKKFDLRPQRTAPTRKSSVPRKPVPKAPADRIVSTVAQAVEILGGVQAVASWRGLSSAAVANMIESNLIHRGHEIEIFLSLRARGYEMTPEMVGADSWDQIMMPGTSRRGAQTAVALLEPAADTDAPLGKLPPLPLTQEARDLHALWCAVRAAEKAANAVGRSGASGRLLVRSREAYARKARKVVDRIVPGNVEDLSKGITLSDLATLALVARLGFSDIPVPDRACMSYRVRHGLDHALLGAAGIRQKNAKTYHLALPAEVAR